jgi:hypothetical protein
MVSISDWKSRAGQALRTLTQHRAAGPVFGALAILLVTRYGPVPTPLSAPVLLSRDAATAAATLNFGFYYSINGPGGWSDGTLGPGYVPKYKTHLAALAAAKANTVYTGFENLIFSGVTSHQNDPTGACCETAYKYVIPSEKQIGYSTNRNLGPFQTVDEGCIAELNYPSPNGLTYLGPVQLDVGYPGETNYWTCRYQRQDNGFIGTTAAVSPTCRSNFGRS